jgi:YtxH-like protein
VNQVPAVVNQVARSFELIDEGAAMKDDGGGAGTVIVAFVLGAITGAAVALLTAPTSGDEVRRMLGEKARDGRERANEAARQGREFLNRQRENLATAVERGREAYEQAKSGAVPGAAPGSSGDSL